MKKTPTRVGSEFRRSKKLVLSPAIFVENSLLPASSVKVVDEVAEILCACCGAGQMALEIAQSLKGRILGVDLSLKSLGYAKRKALELGISSIEFAQADVMELGALGRSFDLVECSGALHYFADPFAGWRILLSLLRPGGHMLLGLYSKVARRGIMAMRERIAQWDYGSSPNDIRRCRQDLRDLDERPDLGILNTYDFFGVSTCRDLLFHVQEQQIELHDDRRVSERKRPNVSGF